MEEGTASIVKRKGKGGIMEVKEVQRLDFILQVKVTEASSLAKQLHEAGVLPD